MKLPEGRLLRRRVVTDLTTPLARALDTELTGYLRLQSQDALLLDSDGVGVLTFEDGVPVLAYHTGTDRAGNEALTDIAVSGPYRVELYTLDDSTLALAHEGTELRVEPGMPADTLAGDQKLAARTRNRAPAERVQRREDQSSSCDAVSEFLEDEARITELQEAARTEAKARATDWGFDVNS